MEYFRGYDEDDFKRSFGTLEGTEDDEAIALAITQEESLIASRNINNGNHLDQEISKLIGKAAKYDFVPKINTVIENFKDESSAKKRLHQRLKLYGLEEYDIYGAGNCQFASLSDQLYRTPKMHRLVRTLVIHQLRTQENWYSRFVPGDYKSYCDQMAIAGEWGDHVTIQAAADKYGIQINLITSYEKSVYTEILPRERLSSRLLWLSFFAERHYNSLYPAEEMQKRKSEDPSTCCVS